MVRCAYITHQLAKTSEGGAEHQMIRTMEEISKIRPDYEITRFNLWEDSIDDFDMVHIFNPTNFPVESARIAEYSKDRGKVVVTSPIFYYDGLSSGMGKTFTSNLMDRMLMEFKGLFSMNLLKHINPYSYIQHTLRKSDLILPNSNMEGQMISHLFAIEPKKLFNVPNGVNPRFKNGDPSIFIEEHGLRDFILFVGRIEPIKNVAGLLKAFQRSEIDTDLVIIGKTADMAYYEKCRPLLSERVHMISPLPHESDMLASAYSSAKVVALPSFIETVGLVALEGGLAGANIVITNVGGAREYLGDNAWYVDPKDVDSIADGLRRSYQAERNGRLKDRIMENYTWEKVGALTAQAYDNVMRTVIR